MDKPVNFNKKIIIQRGQNTNKFPVRRVSVLKIFLWFLK